MEDQAKAIPSDGEVIRRPNGDLYEGSILTIGGAWSRRIRDGHGRMKYSNGQVYEGQWKADTMSGHGLMTYSPFLSYLGDWRAGKKHGLGVLQARHGLQSLSWRGRWTELTVATGVDRVRVNGIVKFAYDATNPCPPDNTELFKAYADLSFNLDQFTVRPPPRAVKVLVGGSVSFFFNNLGNKKDLLIGVLIVSTPFDPKMRGLRPWVVEKALNPALPAEARSLKLFHMHMMYNNLCAILCRCTSFMFNKQSWPAFAKQNTKIKETIVFMA